MKRLGLEILTLGLCLFIVGCPEDNDENAVPTLPLADVSGSWLAEITGRAEDLIDFFDNQFSFTFTQVNQSDTNGAVTGTMTFRSIVDRVERTVPLSGTVQENRFQVQAETVSVFGVTRTYRLDGVIVPDCSHLTFDDDFAPATFAIPLTGECISAAIQVFFEGDGGVPDSTTFIATRN